LRASLDTNAIIHFYRADLQNILFSFFDEGVFIYEQIRNIELEHHGRDILDKVYAIALAQTIGAYSLVTDDTKQGGPYMSLLQFDDDIMPFTFADVLILRYLIGNCDAEHTVAYFDAINEKSDLNWSLRSQVAKFIRRFWKNPYRQEDLIWMQKLVADHDIKVKTKFSELQKLI